MSKKDQIELKVFGLYSSVAHDLDCSNNQVDVVYSFYIDEVFKGLKDTNTKQIYLKGLGALRANPACIPNILYSSIAKYRDIVAYLIRFPNFHTVSKYNAIKKIYDKYMTLYEQGSTKMDILLEERIFDKPVNQKQRARLEEFKETRLDTLYESICRLHELTQARSEERGQDSGRHKHQDLERIQFTKR